MVPLQGGMRAPPPMMAMQPQDPTHPIQGVTQHIGNQLSEQVSKQMQSIRADLENAQHRSADALSEHVRQPVNSLAQQKSHRRARDDEPEHTKTPSGP